jgi:hypothetical protein
MKCRLHFVTSFKNELLLINQNEDILNSAKDKIQLEMMR